MKMLCKFGTYPKRLLKKLIHDLFTRKVTVAKWELNLFGIIMVSVGLLAGSYLTAKTIIPKIFALNDTHQAWTFNTVNASNYTYDSTLVTVDNSGARPVTGANKLTNPSFASDNSSWSVTAVNGSTTPTGWAVVPGNSTYSTTDYLAMKYDAKCAATSNLATGLTSPATSYHTYDNSNTNCTSGNSKVVVSVASGYPIANISQTTSATYCNAVSINGGSAHLITNNEWMTVARNAEAQASNWTLGAVGSGYLYAGHNDNSPALALAASTTDTGNNRCAYTDSAGTTEAPSSCPTNTANGASGSVGNQVRVLTLSNGQPIWDIGGNVWQWTNNTIQGKDQPTNASPGFNWREFTALTTYGTLSYDLVRPLSTSYNSTYGVGEIYSDGTSSNTTTYGFLRGGGWSNGANAGAFTLSLNGTPAYTATVLAFAAPVIP